MVNLPSLLSTWATFVTSLHSVWFLLLVLSFFLPFFLAHVCVRRVQYQDTGDDSNVKTTKQGCRFAPLYLLVCYANKIHRVAFVHVSFIAYIELILGSFSLI